MIYPLDGCVAIFLIKRALGLQNWKRRRRRRR